MASFKAEGPKVIIFLMINHGLWTTFCNTNPCHAYSRMLEQPFQPEVVIFLTWTSQSEVAPNFAKVDTVLCSHLDAGQNSQPDHGRHRNDLTDTHLATATSCHMSSANPCRLIIEWANALVPPTPFSGRSGGERSKRPTCAVVQTCKCYRVFEGLGSVNIDCGTMNRMYWYQGFPWLFMECCFHILGMVCLASLA